MQNAKVRNFLFGSVLVGGLVGTGVSSCSQNENDDGNKKNEQTNQDKYGNVALFESLRSKIKFSLAFVENYYPYTYYCGEAWTAGHGLTVLYNADGTYERVTENTPALTLEQSDVYKGRYLTFEVLPDIRDLITVKTDENTLIAACALRYCIGRANFKKSKFLQFLNAGKTGSELAKALTGWRRQDGVPKRLYFFAALMAGAIDYSDLLDLRAEGCYNLTEQDIFVCRNGNPITDKNNFCEWDFSKIEANLKKAKAPRTSVLKLKKGNKWKKVRVECKLVKDVVPEYIWQEVSNASTKQGAQDDKTHTFEYIMLTALGVAGLAHARKKYLARNRNCNPGR